VVALPARDPGAGFRIGGHIGFVDRADSHLVLIVKLPADFYAERNHRRRVFQDSPVLRVVFLAIKNTLGALLLVAGILMLVLPGQGILTILAALTLLDFPGKRRLELRILHLPALLKGINGLRRRAGRKPLSF